MRCRLYTALFLASIAPAQTLTYRAVTPASMSYYAYAPAPPTTAPAGTQLLLTFPNQATGSELTRPNCSPYSKLKYNHYTYDGSWHGPTNGPVYGYFAKFYASTTALSGSAGLSGNLSFEGSLGTNTDTLNQVMIQSYYWSTDACYEYGPEIGFYRLLFTPGSVPEESTVYFYYAMNGNCYGDSSAGTCRDKTTGNSLQPTTISVALTIPSVNSRGGKNWIYSAYMSSATNVRVTVTDPYNSANAVTRNVAIDPAGFFGPTAASMFSTGLSGYLTVTQQRNSVQGGITDSMTNPLKMSILGLTQVLYLATVSTPPTFAQTSTYSRAYGSCAEGNHTILTAGVASSTATPVVRSYPSCTVTVYNPGTINIASIYSDPTGTPKANPFTADTTGNWFFYGASGSFDVRMSGAGIPTPFTLGDVPLFSLGDYHPHNVFAYSLGGAAGTVAAYNPAGTFYSGFTTGATTANMLWTLPSADSAGCLSSNGSFALSIVPCGTGGGGGGGGGTVTVPGGVTQNIQYNNGGVFGGDGNFLWDRLNQQVTVTGTGGTSAIRVNAGYILANGGIVTNVGSWQAYNTDKDGALLRGMHIAPTSQTTGGTGGYINMAPLGYGNTPAPLAGLSAFGLHNALIWVGGNNPMPPDITYGLNTNLYINAAGGLATTNTIFNSIQAPNGGVFGRSFTAANYIQSGNSNGPPAATTNDAFHAGALYYDTALAAEQVYTGVAWVSLTGGGGGGGGSPGGSNTSVQFKAGPTTFGGDTFFYYDTGNHLLTVQALDASHAGIAVGNGYMQSDGGFLSGACSRYNCFQATSTINGTLIGGMAARSFSALTYIEAGNNAGAPTATTGDTFNAGAMFWDTTGGGGMKVYNGSAWVSMVGSATTPGGSNTSVQFNSSGAFGGDTFFFYATATHLLTVNALNATSAGIAVGTGYIQADAGFLSGACTRYNCFQATSTINGGLTGGMAAKSFTATQYVQAGNYAGGVAAGPTITTSDTFHPGAFSYNTTSGCMAVYNGTAWACITTTGGGGTPGGATTNIQFNNAGTFGGSANLAWDNTAFQVSVTGTSGSADVLKIGANAVTALRNGGATATLWSLDRSTGEGVLRLGNGSGTGGFDSNGATVYAHGGTVQAVTYFGGITGGATTDLTFTNSNSNFQVNMAGAVSAVGIFASTGAGGGFNTVNTAFNSVQTAGGMNSGAGTAGFGGYWVSGVPAIDSTTAFIGAKIATVGSATIGTFATVTGLLTSNGGFSAAGGTNLFSTTTTFSGAVLFNGSVASTNQITSGGGFSTTNNAADSIRTSGGINVGNGTAGFGRYQISGVDVIDVNKTFVSPGGISTTGTVTAGSSLTVAGLLTANGGLSVPTTALFSDTVTMQGQILFGTSGKIGAYAGMLTAGQGVAPIGYLSHGEALTATINQQNVTINSGAPPAGWYRFNASVSCRFIGGSNTGVAVMTTGYVNGAYIGGDLLTINCAAGPYIKTSAQTFFTDGTTSVGCVGMCWGVTVNSTPFVNANYYYAIVVERLN